MTPEERAQFDGLKKEVSDLRGILVRLGGSLEFRNIVSRYVREDLNTAGTNFALFGTRPQAKQADHIANPTGGITNDAEARTAINSILVVLENVGLTKKS